MFRKLIHCNIKRCMDVQCTCIVCSEPESLRKSILINNLLAPNSVSNYLTLLIFNDSGTFGWKPILLYTFTPSHCMRDKFLMLNII